MLLYVNFVVRYHTGTSTSLPAVSKTIVHHATHFICSECCCHKRNSVHDFVLLFL